MKLLNVLEDLGDSDLKKFKYSLNVSDEEPHFGAGEVEDKSRVELSKLIVSRCTRTGAPHRTVQTLRAIGCNEEARRLEQWSKTHLEELSQRSQAQAVPGPRTPLGRVFQKPQEAQVSPANLPKNNPLGQTTLVFGKHIGKTFEWLLENDKNYAVYLVATHLEEKEKGDTTNDPKRMEIKDALAAYVSLFPDVMNEVEFYRKGMRPLGFGKYSKKHLMDLYNSKEDEHKSYVQWLRSNVQTCTKGSKMEAAISYIQHRDEHQPSSSFSYFSAAKRSYKSKTTTKAKGKTLHSNCAVCERSLGERRCKKEPRKHYEERRGLEKRKREETEAWKRGERKDLARRQREERGTEERGDTEKTDETMKMRREKIRTEEPRREGIKQRERRHGKKRGQRR
ncbi:hypothetical protein WMY93_026052 [Mugilogobius chulae]|uniref:Pyrin domain-containing protein n=1 Tax=Mugilogobius chulae TaxID=88201 RepID=A0AAW0N160_9GOBI